MKTFDRRQMLNIIGALKNQGRRIVFTNGCFDILHAGHVRYLASARTLGDCLIVGLNSDSSVQSLKGPTRPINSEEDRAEVLSALSAVDYVVVFNDQTAESLVAELKPDVYVKGGDYNLENLPEAKIVKEYGGETIFIPLVPGRSTTNIIQKASQHD